MQGVRLLGQIRFPRSRFRVEEGRTDPISEQSRMPRLLRRVRVPAADRLRRAPRSALLRRRPSDVQVPNGGRRKYSKRLTPRGRRRAASPYLNPVKTRVSNSADCRITDKCPRFGRLFFVVTSVMEDLRLNG